MDSFFEMLNYQDNPKADGSYSELFDDSPYYCEGNIFIGTDANYHISVVISISDRDNDEDHTPFENTDDDWDDITQSGQQLLISRSGCVNNINFYAFDDNYDDQYFTVPDDSCADDSDDWPEFMHENILSNFSPSMIYDNEIIDDPEDDINNWYMQTYENICAVISKRLVLEEHTKLDF